MRRFARAAIELVLVPLCLAALATPALAQSSSGLQPPFVYLADVAPDIQQDMRYASTNNFLGRRVDGYQAAECILTDKTAEALKRVQAALKEEGLSLRVYDCYRPEVAVSDFVRWSQQESDTKTKQQYYPDLDKRNLFKLGYIATRSMHSRGNTVDLTIVRVKDHPIPSFKEQYRQVRCDAAEGKRAPENSLDFGTGYDCFDPKSHTWSTQIPDEAKRNRRLLVAAMEAEKFQNYSKEWWHFELRGGATPVAHNFPIRKRPEQPKKGPEQTKKDDAGKTALVVPPPVDCPVSMHESRLYSVDCHGNIVDIEAPRADDARKRLEAEKRQLDAEQKRASTKQADLDKNVGERGRINARLLETGKHIQQSEARLGAIESKLGEFEIQEKHLRGSLEQRHGTISALLAALQRMGRNPPPVMITRREDALTMVRSAMLLASAFPELRVQAVGLAQELGDLARVMKSSRTEGEKLKAEKTKHEEVRIRLATLQEDKRQSGAQHQAELHSVRQEVARMAKNVEEMGDLLQRLDKELVGRAALGSFGKEIAGTEPKSLAPGETDRKTAAVLAPSGERVAMLAPGRIKPNVQFAEAKGMLQLPVPGRRVLSFGQKTQSGTQSKGIGIQTRYGGTVLSPCDGLIVYAAEFRTYGQVLIISAGDGYHILLAGLSQIEVQVGQSVLMGEPVGVMSSAGKSPAAQDSGPVLNVEFRKDQRPIDPDPWWSDASRKVQG